MGIMEFYPAETRNRSSKQPRIIRTLLHLKPAGRRFTQLSGRMIEPFSNGIIKAASDPIDGHQVRGIREPISLAIFEASQQIPAA
jgi:hypothetical protein